MKINSLLLVILVLIIAGCKKEDRTMMAGTITFSFIPEPGNFYVFLDDDLDISNGYVIRLVATSDGPISNLEYNFNTENIPAGSYYLRGGYDKLSEGTPDPEDPSSWEGAGWYGSSSFTPPSSPDITRLYGTYDFIIYEML